MGRTGGHWQKEQAGWLKNKDRRERRDHPGTLTDKQVLQLLNDIESIDAYTKLPSELDRLIRMRDQALTALSWIFFKRAKENLRVKLSDVFFDDTELMVTYHVQKKTRRYRLCASCNTKNAKRSNFCKQCGADIRQAELLEVKGGADVFTKTKKLEYPFCRYVVDWIQELRKIGADLESYIFSAFNYGAGTFIFDRPLSVQRFDQILWRLDPTLSSHMFRYGHAEKLLRSGYTTYELKVIGDWASTKMPEEYAERKGVTPEQKKFSDDIRII